MNVSLLGKSDMISSEILPFNDCLVLDSSKAMTAGSHVTLRADLGLDFVLPLLEPDASGPSSDDRRCKLERRGRAGIAVVKKDKE